MIISSSCSWCHRINPTSAVYCPECGHMAHVSRLACRCGRCRDQHARALRAVAEQAPSRATLLAYGLAELERDWDFGDDEVPF